ncbi:hypothetical protein D3C85_1435860 [compost metagenome]
MRCAGVSMCVCIVPAVAHALTSNTCIFPLAAYSSAFFLYSSSLALVRKLGENINHTAETSLTLSIEITLAPTPQLVRSQLNSTGCLGGLSGSN